jgi:hypothetical protein
MIEIQATSYMCECCRRVSISKAEILRCENEHNKKTKSGACCHDMSYTIVVEEDGDLSIYKDCAKCDYFSRACSISEDDISLEELKRIVATK